MLEDAVELLGILAVGIVGARGQPFDKDARRRAEQDDVIELLMEASLVRRRAADKQHVRVLGREEALYPVLAPDLITVVPDGVWIGGRVEWIAAADPHPFGPFVRIEID